MKSFIILAVCMSVLVPVRVAITNCLHAEKTADEIVQNVSSTITENVRQAKCRLRLKTSATSNTVAKGISQCVRTGVDQVKAVTEDAVSIALNIESENGPGSRNPGYLKSSRAYLDLTLLAAVFTLLRRSDKRSA